MALTLEEQIQKATFEKRAKTLKEAIRRKRQTDFEHILQGAIKYFDGIPFKIQLTASEEMIIRAWDGWCGKDNTYFGVPIGQLESKSTKQLETEALVEQIKNVQKELDTFNVDFKGATPEEAKYLKEIGAEVPKQLFKQSKTNIHSNKKKPKKK